MHCVMHIKGLFIFWDYKEGLVSNEYISIWIIELIKENNINVCLQLVKKCYGVIICGSQKHKMKF